MNFNQSINLKLSFIIKKVNSYTLSLFFVTNINVISEILFE